MPDTTPDPMVEGLEKLLRMKPLDGFDFDRWAQIRRDCTKLLKDYGSVIREFGWTVSDVFGYQPRGRGTVGLGVDLRGGTITRMKPRHVLVWRPNAGSSKQVRASGWAQSREMVPIWEGADVDGPVWHRPRHLPVPAPVAVQPALMPDQVEVPMLVMPPHVFAAFTGPSCAIHQPRAHTTLVTVSSLATDDAAAHQWVAGIARLQHMFPPKGFSSDRWELLCSDCTRLLEHHGDDMRRLGQSTVDAFGVHPTAPAVAVRCYGLGLLLKGAKVIELTSGARQMGAVPICAVERWRRVLEAVSASLGHTLSGASHAPSRHWNQPSAHPGRSAGHPGTDMTGWVPVSVF